MLTASLAAGDDRFFRVFRILAVDLQRETCIEAQGDDIAQFGTCFVSFHARFEERQAKMPTRLPGRL